VATIVHISDLHFGWPYVEEVGEAVLGTIEEVRPEAVVVSGDLVQRGDFPRLWEQAKTFLSRLARPFLVVPGNHDIPLWNPIRRLFRPFAYFRRYVGRDLDPVLHVPGAVIAGISTPRWWTIDLGHVGCSQLARARRALEAAPPGALRVVALHHGLLPQEKAGLTRHHVRGHERAIRAFSDMGVRLVLSGHNHYPHVGLVTGRNGDSLVLAQAGTACSKRLRGGCRRNSLNVIRTRGRAIEIETRFYDGRRFEAGERRRFGEP
jgi:3',5'-cyclic AMP phosphodiesterase CpdA